MEENGNEACREQRDDQVTLCLEQGPQRGHDQDIEPGNAGRENTIDQRAVDDDVDIVQLMSEDSDTDCHRDTDSEPYYSNSADKHGDIR